MSTQHKIAPLTVGVEAAYQSLGIGRTAFYRLVRAGELKTIHFGKRAVVPVAELQRVVADRIAAGNKPGDAETK